MRKFEDMEENVKSQKAQVCDSRVPASFNRSADGTVDKLELIWQLKILLIFVCIYLGIGCSLWQ